MREEGDSGVDVGFGEKPNGAHIQNNAASEGEQDKLDEDEAGNLGNCTMLGQMRVLKIR